jgi:hypothetical protein
MSMVKKFARRVRGFLNGPILDTLNGPILDTLRSYTPPDAAAQLALSLAYRGLADANGPLPAFRDVGFKAYSQTDEDGILLFIFSVIGTTNKTSVEICAGNGIECNTANLIINHGWTGLLMDGNSELVRQGKRFYEKNPGTYVDPPVFACNWIKRNNVNELVSENGFAGEIDLLSLDLDGVDYWIWEAIEVISPRVVVLEYLDIVGPDRALTVPYADDFSAWQHPVTGGMPNFCGASLPAFVKLARRKGYRLVGCNRSGFNAFFVKNNVGGTLREIPVKDCFTNRKTILGMKDRWPTVKDHPWVEV